MASNRKPEANQVPNMPTAYIGLNVCMNCGWMFGGRKVRYCQWCKAKNGQVVAVKWCIDCGKRYESTGPRGKRCKSCADTQTGKKRRERHAKMRASGIRSASQAAQVGRYSTHKRGMLGEVLFDVLAIRKDWSPCRPVNNVQPKWDRIIQRNGELFTVQIKTTADATKVKVGRSDQPVTAGDFDLLCVVEETSGTIWMYDWRPLFESHANNASCVTVRMSRDKGERYSVMWDGDD